MRPTREPLLTQCGVQTRRWVNQSQPQTLVFATYLLYFGAVMAVLASFSSAFSAHTGLGYAIANTLETAQRIEDISILFVAAGGAYAGYQIAQEKKLGYFLGIAVAAVPLVAKTIALLRGRIDFADLITVSTMFDVALMALIVHDQSRNYVRIWFK